MNRRKKREIGKIEQIIEEDKSRQSKEQIVLQGPSSAEMEIPGEKKSSNPDRQRLVILQLQKERKKNKNWVKKILIIFYGVTRELSRDFRRAGGFALPREY